MFKKKISPVCVLSEYGKQKGFTNHLHKCEFIMLYGTLKDICPHKCKDDHDDICDNCKHLRIVNLSDDGLHIIGME